VNRGTEPKYQRCIPSRERHVEIHDAIANEHSHVTQHPRKATVVLLRDIHLYFCAHTTAPTFPEVKCRTNALRVDILCENIFTNVCQELFLTSDDRGDRPFCGYYQ